MSSGINLMFELEEARILFEEADRDYQQAKKEYKELGVSTETLKNLYLTNMNRVEMKKKLDSITPTA